MTLKDKQSYLLEKIENIKDVLVYDSNILNVVDEDDEKFIQDILSDLFSLYDFILSEMYQDQKSTVANGDFYDR